MLPSSDSQPETHHSFGLLLTSEKLLDVLDQRAFHTPTPVQAAAIPAAIAGKDLIVQAKTGSGKTLAFVLPLLQRLEEQPELRGTVGLIVCPTRELAVQICEVIRQVGGIEAPCLIGGTSMAAQRKALDEDPRIVVGTPGRVIDFIGQRELVLRKCSYVVLDEADEMLSMDFLKDIEEIMARLPAQRQGIFISATITSRVEGLARRFLKDAQRIVIDTPGEAHASIDHEYYDVGPELAAKSAALCDLLEVVKPNSTIIFCNTKSDTELVEVYLRRRGFDARRINSDLEQKQRDKVMAKIRAGDLRYLVGTDIAARGIDIEQIDLVVNYSLSDQPEVYVHRTGRTGRAGRSGRAISLIGPADFTAFQALKRETTIDIKKCELPSEEVVLEARLQRFNELLERSTALLNERDLKLAKHATTKLTNPADAEKFLARLMRFAFEHMLKAEMASLEEDLRPAEINPRGHGGGGGGGGHHRGGGRGGRGRDSRGGGRRDHRR